LSEPSILEISGALLVVHDPIPAACPTGWKKTAYVNQQRFDVKKTLKKKHGPT